VHGNNYSLQPLAEYKDEYFRWFEQACNTLHQHLQNKGITADPDAWKKNFWYHKLQSVMQEITTVVSPATSFILIDDNLWKFNDFGSAYHRLPFLEQYGKYCWPPTDDEEAIAEIKQLQQKVARFIVFAWPAFWWLD
jgi:hypothetical protein